MRYAFTYPCLMQSNVSRAMRWHQIPLDSKWLVQCVQAHRHLWCAHALANTMPTLGNRELDLCVNKLLGESIVIPWPIQVQFSAKKLQFMLDELCEIQPANLGKLTDDIMDMICARKHISHPVRYESAMMTR